MAQFTADSEITIAFDTVGEGPSVILVHGITESRRSWDPLIPAFVDAGYEVTAVDLRGHGESSVTPPFDSLSLGRDIAEVAAHKDRPLIIGHSLGGVIAAICASHAEVRGAIILDQPLALAGFQAGLQEAEPFLRGSDAEFGAAMAQIFASMAGPLGGSAYDHIEGLRHGRQEVVLGVWDQILTTPVEELDGVVATMTAGITAPVLSLHGIDPGPDYAPWLTTRIPTAVTEIWADHGHYPHLVDPDRFLARVRAFDESLRS